MVVARGEAPCFVLVVDDDDDIRESMAFALELRGLHVATAPNGAEALALLRGGGALPNVIVLDLMMPTMNGYEFREEQLRDPKLAEIPVLVLTGFGQSLAEATRLRAAEGLDKPSSVDALESAIRRASKRAV